MPPFQETFDRINVYLRNTSEQSAFTKCIFSDDKRLLYYESRLTFQDEILNIFMTIIFYS